MSLAFSVLGSGSGGNCTLLSMSHDGETRFALIDCGLSVRDTRRRLGTLGVSLDDVADILLTHLDTDHFRPYWDKFATKRGVRIHVHARQHATALRCGVSGCNLHRFDEGFELDGAATVHAVHFAHDELGTVGFGINHNELRMGFATDLGRVPESLFDRFVDLHAVALESNYDRDLQLSSHRPWLLKKRIMGGRGHLSNEQSLEAIVRIDQQSQLSRVTVLHLSRQCNDPGLIQRLYNERAPHLCDRLTLTSQFHPTPLLEVVRGPQPAPRPPRPPRQGEQLAIFRQCISE